MKKYIFSLLAILFIVPAFAQKTKVDESNEKIAGNNNNALVVWIKNSDKKIVSKEWVALMKKNKAKVSNKKEIFADDVILPNISANTVDIYAVAEQNKSDVKLIVAFDLGGAFLNSKMHNEQYKVAEKMVYDFAVEMSKQNLQSSITAENKKISDFEKKKSKLESDSKNKQKEIDNMKKKIDSYEKIIGQNQKDIEGINKDINDTKTIIDGLEKQFKTVD